MARLVEPRQFFQQNAAHQGQLVPLAQLRPGCPDIVTLALDLAENALAAADEELDIRPHVLRQVGDQRHALLEEFRCRVDLESQQLGKLRRESPGLEIIVAVAKAAPVFFRQINPADVEIAVDVLPEIGQLQGSANAIRPDRRWQR